MKDIMVPEVGKSIILQNNFFITIGDSLIPLPVSNSPPPPFPPPLLRVEKTPNVLISVIFVQKYGDDCEIWCADLAGNLSIWDPKKKECLFEFLWAKNEVNNFYFYFYFFFYLSLTTNSLFFRDRVENLSSKTKVIKNVFGIGDGTTIL